MGKDSSNISVEVNRVCSRGLVFLRQKALLQGKDRISRVSRCRRSLMISSLSCLELSLLRYFSESLLPSFQLNRTFETHHKGNMLTVR